MELWTFRQACGDDNFKENAMFTKEGCFFYKIIYDLGPEKVFTVHSRWVFNQDKSGYFSNSKVYGKRGPGRSVHYKGVFTNQGC